MCHYMSVAMQSLTSRILYTQNVKWRDLKFLQQDTFKDFSDIDKQRLKNSLVGNQFLQPFYVWKDQDESNYCLDGKHRTILLEELISDGVEVPDMLPATFIDCRDKQEAAKLVLVFSSAYARVTLEGFNEFIALHELDAPEILEQISIPDLVFIEEMPLPEILDGDPKNKVATMKITFENAAQLERLLPAIDEILKAESRSIYYSVSAGEI